ncbi:MAG TPA: pyrimidine reductase family protein [Streptosporangiaceae bacterium]|nr:pyrimidine reductase family protein [Streptosporangiaceae bacterium]
MRQIFPGKSDEQSYIEPAGPLTEPVAAGAPGTAEMIEDLAACYPYPDGLWVRANMVTSLDGAIAVDGRSGGLSGAADRALFHVLRSLADVILVGAGTARAERYGLAKPGSIWSQLRQGRQATPPIAVVTRDISLDLDSQLIRGDDSLPRTIVLTTSRAPADRVAAAAKTAHVIVAGDDEVSARAAIDTLAELGHRRILVEGGPTLLGQLVSANLVDELCVTISPLIADGHGPRMIVQHGPVEVTRLSLASLIEDDGFLLGRYVRRAVPLTHPQAAPRAADQPG